MSIKPFENIDCSQLEAILRDGYEIDMFRLGAHIFLSIHHNKNLLARAVGESISIVLQRAESYVNHNFRMPELYNGHASKLDSLILDSGAHITLEAIGLQFRGKIFSHDVYLLVMGKGGSISTTLQSLEESAITYGL